MGQISITLKKGSPRPHYCEPCKKQGVREYAQRFLNKDQLAAEQKLKVYDKLIEITNRELDQDFVKKIEAGSSRSSHRKSK